ncbi:unnamed protein product [Adineta steineri]|uniref:Uncharacterized protein n=1 Tax=Adineta steineri TaxID=433720 RepID=A0A813YGB2_9BILA|nr:unnamed protein product [Adineta steineri]CAF3720518.1 unnamed protein product [Adineta steineri]
MTLKSNWNILSDYDSEFDLKLSSRYPNEPCSISALKKLSINRNEPPLTRSRTKAIDNTILFSKQQSSDNQLPNSPTDGVNSLTNWLQSCSLDESKLNKNSLPITSSSHLKFRSNPFFIQTASTTTLYDQQQNQLWSRFHFATSTLQDNVWIEQLNLTSSNIFNNQSSPQVVPPTVITQDQITNSKFLKIKEENLLSKIFFTLIIFAFGLIHGYLITNTFPSNLIRHWIYIIWNICMSISIEYFHFLYAYIQILIKYFSSFLLV